MKNLIIGALVALLAIAGTFAALATTQTTARVEVRVWQRVSDGSLYLSTRPEDGRWTTHNEALDMSELSASGNFRQSSFVTVEVPVDLEVPDAAAEPEWCDDRPSWRTAARIILPGSGGEPVTGFYSLDSLAFGEGQRDHILPWSIICELVEDEAAARDAFNDTGNLVASSPEMNGAKSDDLADEWLPQWHELDAEGYAANACEYARRYRAAAEDYGHGLSGAEEEVLEEVCE
ncbi:MAG: hypothetical protein OXS47_04335 [Chloroflexota bacterium]|nr:hypothetical protein [Chloroflexota bacterium]